MIGFFKSLPSWLLQVAQTGANWAAHNPMTFALVTVILGCAAWLNLFAIVQRRDRRAATDRTKADPSKPGAFPGDNR